MIVDEAAVEVDVASDTVGVKRGGKKEGKKVSFQQQKNKKYKYVTHYLPTRL